MWSMGPHGCAGRAIAITALATMTKVCAQLKNLRRAPGLQGQIKSIPGALPGSKQYLSDDWSRFQPFAGSKFWPLCFSDFSFCILLFWSIAELTRYFSFSF